MNIAVRLRHAVDQHTPYSGDLYTQDAIAFMAVKEVPGACPHCGLRSDEVMTWFHADLSATSAISLRCASCMMVHEVNREVVAT